MYALVDDEDEPIVHFFKWAAVRSGHKWYARAFVRGAGFKIRMHELLVDAPDGLAPDHKNGNGLDNRRRNLRVATVSQNAANRPKSCTNTSGFKGVSRWHDGRWQSGIKINQKRIALGLFRSKIDAARAYDKAAKVHHGEFASPNFR